MKREHFLYISDSTTHEENRLAVIDERKINMLIIFVESFKIDFFALDLQHISRQHRLYCIIKVHN